MALDADLMKACKYLEIKACCSGKIGLCYSKENPEICSGTVVEERETIDGRRNVSYLNLGQVQQCAEERNGYRS